MRLTDTTVVRKLANGRIVVTEGTSPAVFISAHDVFVCGDLYHGVPAFTLDPDYDGEWFPESPSDMVQSCAAFRVGFDNGSACVDGHQHFTDAEYYEEGEVEARRHAGDLIAPNARLMDGRSPF